MAGGGEFRWQKTGRHSTIIASVRRKVYLVEDELHVKISFFGGLSFGRVGEPELTLDEVMLVASLEDLMAHRALFGPAFQPSESLKALTYFKGGDLDQLPSSIQDILIAAASRVRALPPVEVVSRRLV